MTKETLKQLIEVEFERAGTTSQFKSEVFRLIDLYESDKQSTTGYQNSLLTVPCGNKDVPYSSICSCNPKNGGNGICQCILGNNMTTTV